MADIDRRELHTLVDHIPESDVPAARKVLRAFADPVELAILAAPLDDEPETEDERASVASSLADISPDIPFEKLRRRKDADRRGGPTQVARGRLAGSFHL